MNGSFRSGTNFDEFVKIQKSPVFVIPAKAGIQGNHPAAGLDFRLRGSDDLGNFLRDHQLCEEKK